MVQLFSLKKGKGLLVFFVFVLDTQISNTSNVFHPFPSSKFKH